MHPQLTTERPAMAMPPFDPREQPVKHLLPSREDVSRAKAKTFKERGDYIRRAARLGPAQALRAILDVYGDEGLAVLIEYDQLCDRHGSATMSRLLEELRAKEAGL